MPTERYFIIKRDRQAWPYMLCRGDDYPRCEIIHVYMTMGGARRAARRHERKGARNDQMRVVWDSADRAGQAVKRGLVAR